MYRTVRRLTARQQPSNLRSGSFVFDVDGTYTGDESVTLAVDDDEDVSTIEAFVPPGLRTSGRSSARVRFDSAGATVEGWAS